MNPQSGSIRNRNFFARPNLANLPTPVETGNDALLLSPGSRQPENTLLSELLSPGFGLRELDRNLENFLVDCSFL